MNTKAKLYCGNLVMKKSKPFQNGYGAKNQSEAGRALQHYNRCMATHFSYTEASTFSLRRESERKKLRNTNRKLKRHRVISKFVTSMVLDNFITEFLLMTMIDVCLFQGQW